MNEFLWMCVSRDSLELPILAAGSAGELAAMMGASTEQVVRAVDTQGCLHCKRLTGVCRVKKIFLGPYTEGSAYEEDSRLAREANMCKF